MRSRRRALATRWVAIAGLTALIATLVVTPVASAASDHVLPSVAAPVTRLSSGYGITFGTVATGSITVTGHDAGGFWSSGNTAQFAISRNGGAYVAIHPTTVRVYGTYDTDGVARTMSLVIPRTFALTGTYRVRARMRDRAGNWSHWMTGPLLSPRLIHETSPHLAYTSGWTHVADPSPNVSYETASAAGETATLAFTARSIAWLTHQGLDHGTAEVRIDGVLVATVDSASRHPGHPLADVLEDLEHPPAPRPHDHGARHARPSDRGCRGVPRPGLTALPARADRHADTVPSTRA